MSSDPWDGLASPGERTMITARRVSVAGRWDFYWGRDHEERSLLILRHAPLAGPLVRLPNLRGIEVTDRPATSSDKPALILSLLDPALRDIFHRLCQDIIDAAAGAHTEADAVASALSRTWRWHYLLRGGGGAALSDQEQIGLLAELAMLEEFVLASSTPPNALSAWLGPLGAPQDFVSGTVGIEVKSRGASDSATVHINSEHQLDDSRFDSLFLSVRFYERERIHAPGETLSDVVTRLRERFAGAGERIESEYNSLLLAAGFRYEDDYSASRWRSTGHRLYKVTAKFPRLIQKNSPDGVSNVKYELSLARCQASLISDEMLSAALRGIRE